MSQKPNILMIMTDQLRADWLGCMGHPVVKTPNIDALAAQGTKFTNFHVATPVCMPNRGSIFTGRYPSVHGLRHNGLHLPLDQSTFVEVLRDGGYNTALIGKSHLQPFTGMATQKAGKITGNANFPEARKDAASYEMEHPDNYEQDGHFEFPKPHYGFDHTDIVTLHGTTCSGHYLQWLREQRPDWAELRDPKNQLPHNYTCPQAVRTPIPEDLYSTSYIKMRGVEYLNAQDDKKPFFAFVSFPDPHHPFNPPGKYWDMYSPQDFSVDLPFEAHQNPTPALQACKDQLEDGTRFTAAQKLFMARDQELREAMALSAGMITMIDDAIGELIAALKANGQWDNTIVIFNADHGDYLGAFNLLLKGPIAHHSINRVPCIIRDPASDQAVVRDDLCSSLDLGPTLMARAGLDPYNGLHGQDLFGGNGRETLMIEHEDSSPKPGFKQIANVRTLLSATHRLSVYRGEEWGELYDLQADPDETRNLWDDPTAAAVKSGHLVQLTEAMIAAVDTSPWPKYLA
jgi:arylsulfatase A-like enzyme